MIVSEVDGLVFLLFCFCCFSISKPSYGASLSNNIKWGCTVSLPMGHLREEQPMENKRSNKRNSAAKITRESAFEANSGSEQLPFCKRTC